MFSLKLVLELATLAGLYFLLKKSLATFLPIFGRGAMLGDMSEFQGERKALSIVFFALGVVFSIINFWVIYGALTIFHNVGNFESVMVISQKHLFLPSLIAGFYLATSLSKSAYITLFGEDEFIFFQDLDAQKKSSLQKAKKLGSSIILAPAVLLLSFQVNVYMKTDGQRIYTKAWGEKEQVFTIAEITKLDANGAHDLDIYLANGEMVTTEGYSGNINQFLDNISR